MAGQRLLALQRQFNELRSGIDTIERSATSQNRDLTETETADLDRLFERAEAIRPDIEAEAAREQSLSAVADVLARVNGGTPTSIERAAQPRREAPELTAGEYLSAFLRSHHPDGDMSAEEFTELAGRYIDRAIQTTTDTAGILPEPIVGKLLDFSDFARPVWDSMAHPTMPAKGKTFHRPRITQHVTVGVQAAEGDTLASQKMLIASDPVTKATYGGTLDISRQDIDWTEPSAMDAVLRDFADVYAEFTESKACDFLEGLIVAGDTASNGSTYSAYTTTNIGTIVSSYVAAIQAVYAKSKKFPDRVWVDLASWGVLAGSSNTDNSVTALQLLRQALSDFGADLKFVVGPQLAPNTRIVGVSSLVEAYEQRLGLLRAEMPSSLKVQVAYAGYVAFWGKHEGFVQLGADPSA